VRDATEPKRGDGEAITRTPSEVALHRLRMVGLGIIAAAVVVDALQAPYLRWCSLKTRIAMRLDPLDPSDGMLVTVVADLLSALDGVAPPRTLR
jgi:hypothetical protein